MLIEFTGPSASGKSAFVAHLMRTMPAAQGVRRSVCRATPRWIARLLWASAPQAHRLPAAYVNARRWFARHPPNHPSAPKLAARLAGEYGVLHGLRQDGRLWLLDQGGLQTGSWLPFHIAPRLHEHAAALRGFIALGDAVVVLQLPSELSVARVRARGRSHLATGDRVARARGFRSFRDMCDAQFDHVDSKIAFARALGSAVLHIRLDERGAIAETRLLPACGTRHLSGDRDHRALEVLATLRLRFADWWKPLGPADAPATGRITG